MDINITSVYATNRAFESPQYALESAELRTTIAVTIIRLKCLWLRKPFRLLRMLAYLLQ